MRRRTSRGLRARYGRARAYSLAPLHFRDLPRRARFTLAGGSAVYEKTGPSGYRPVPDDGSIYAATAGWNPQVEWL